MTGLPPGHQGGIGGCRLITIPLSHYCEKARWALDHCGVTYAEQGHMPLFHALAVRRAGGGHSVPLLVTDQGVIRESSEIAAWADQFSPGRLIPKKSAARQRALEWQRGFDLQLGPATRVWAYFQLLPKQRELLSLMVRGTPRWQRSAFTAWYPMITSMMRGGMNITSANAEESSRMIDAIFARVADQLSDGRRFLVEDQFSIADLAFAALAAPVVLPDEHPAMPDALDAFDRSAQRQIHAWRASVAGRFALRLYAAERR